MVKILTVTDTSPRTITNLNKLLEFGCNRPFVFFESWGNGKHVLLSAVPLSLKYTGGYSFKKWLRETNESLELIIDKDMTNTFKLTLQPTDRKHGIWYNSRVNDEEKELISNIFERLNK